jgi:predicted metalloprotease with PDZ domain
MIDLKNAANDRVKVTVFPPHFKEKSAVYVIPKTIPGTYENQEYIRFVHDIKAFDAKGKLLKNEREKDKQIRILEAQRLARLEYYVSDSFDDTNTAQHVFPPGGTNIQKDTNFLINPSGFYGYFENYKSLAYSVTVLKPQGFYGATSLAVQNINDTTDVLKAQDYVFAVDNPVMYARPDTAEYWEGKTRIQIAAYSPDTTINAKLLKNILQPVTGAIENFLGTMPVDRYTFIFYFLAKDQSPVSTVNGWGALEHSYSSVYFLPATEDSTYLRNIISSVAAHEFLHILVPLGTHSREIHDFDFRAPKMSQHLWLYEGVTEYFSHLAQVQSGLITEDDFLKEMRGKIYNTEELDKPLSLTTFSKRVLEPEYQELYPIIYDKGAVAALLLDIRLRELTNGDMTLLKLVQRLGEIYGPDKPFEDNELIDTIVKITHPQIGGFFKNYIIGSNPLPYEEYFQKIGWNFERNKQMSELSFGDLNVSVRTVNNKPRIRFENYNGDANDFGIKKGDVLLKINNQEIVSSGNETWKILDKTIFKPETAKETTVEIQRGTGTLVLKATPKLREYILPFVVSVQENATPEQVAFKKQIFSKDKR